MIIFPGGDTAEDPSEGLEDQAEADSAVDLAAAGDYPAAEAPPEAGE